VIAAGGDGDGYAIGAGHFVHAVRRNPDITYIVMDNQTYGLTKGQASPTSATGYVASVSPNGNPDAPINGLAVALAAGASFLARGFSAQPKQMVALIKAAIEHRGFSIVEVMSPCVTYNKINTYAWFKDHVEDVAQRPDYAPNDRLAAFAALTREGDIPLGIIYEDNRPTLEDGMRLPQAPIARLDLRADDPRFAAMREAFR
jgi:2-oxoglutarate ferredoxin oxidoreductase subunit beta